MEHIEEYIKRPQSERQAHLRLDEPCIERGGSSTHLRGLMAYLANTTIPIGKKIHVCHACHNGKCGNPNHIYWGTAQENRMDAITNDGGKSIWDNLVLKYGQEEASKRMSRSSASASRSGKGNIGTVKSEEHKRKISEALLGRKRGQYKK